MYLINFTDFYDYYKDRGCNKTYYELYLTKEKAEIRAIDLLYKHINEYLKDSEMDLEVLEDRSKYSIDDLDELLSIIETEFVEHKYKVEIKQIEILNE